MLFRVRGIVESLVEPENKEGIIWLHSDDKGNRIMSIWRMGQWVPISNTGGGIELYFGSVQPEDTDVLWIDTDGNAITLDNPVVTAIYKRLGEIDKVIAEFSKVITYGVIAGSSSNAAREDIAASADPINPNGDDEEEGDEEEAIQPDASELEYTVPNISVKQDTAANFQANYRNLLDGELVFTTDQLKLYIYYNGAFLPVGSGSGGSGGGMSAAEIMQFFFNYLGFEAETGGKYRIFIDGNEVLTVYGAEEQDLVMDTGTGTGQDVWVSGRLNINTVFIGGDGDARSYQSCSHNMVELANCSTRDINLNNLYLLYAPDTDTPWTALPLRGKIKAGGTFVIRGAQCAAKTNTTIIDVDEYDQEWRVNGELISFEQKSPTFYLAWGDNGQFYNEQDVLVPASQLTRVVYHADHLFKGYIDSVGFGTGAASEGSSPVQITSGDSWSDLLFVRHFTLDPVNQANKAFTARKSNNLWTYINLQKNADETVANPIYYYTRDSKIKFRPRKSLAGKNIFTSKSVFDDKKPNAVNITFGRQATYKDSTHKASRCFNWVSVGYYDEYLEYTTAADVNWQSSQQIDSITEKSIQSGGYYYGNTVVTTFIDQYKRIRWITTNNTAVTSHKILLQGLDAGTYKYRIRRRGDDSYVSDVRQFTVWADSQVGSFSYVQTSDQQGFNWLEYQAWKKASFFISQEHPDIKFTVNTGDITQNGNRESEWLDYYDGRQFLFNLEEMFTIGNNDLCGVNEWELGTGQAGTYKINHKNILFYYTFELDPENSPIFHSGDTVYYMPSMYSFNFGSWHFVSLNSEFAANTYKVYQESAGTFIADTYTQMADWFKKDLQLWQGTSGEPANCSKCIVYCHEMPYTIITHATYIGSNGRGGSKLNTMKTHDYTYYWSRIFKQYGIRLVMGGHKHTYSMTRPVYDAPADYINNSTHAVNPSADLWGTISNDASMKPVVQVTDVSEIPVGGQATARYEVVQKIDAPVYVMSQATGYKLVSNQEIPCRDNVEWLRAFFPGSAKYNDDGTDSGTDTANPAQYRPTYIHYALDDEKIVVTSYQVQNVYSEPTASKAGSFNINNQSSAALDNLAIENGTYTIIL